MADILMSIFATIFFKFPIFGVFPESFYEENWSVVPVAGVNYLGHSQAIGIIFIAVNRFTAVYFPVRHKQRWWRPQVIRSLMVIQWTIPLIFIIPLFFTEFNFVMDRSTGSVTFSSKDAVFHKVYFVGLAILDGIVVNTIVSALYIAIFIRVQTHVVVQKPGELAMRLALSAFIIFISYCTLGIFSVLAAMTRPEDAWMYRTLWFVVNDVLCASNAPILLALNKPIRRVYMKKIGLQRRENRTKGSLICHI
nr:7TM GPCR domain containing protein [Haemonchus contortus]